MRRIILTGVVGVLLTAASAAPAAAQSKLFVGFAEDSPKWGGESAVAPLRVLGAEAVRLTVGWAPGETSLSPTTEAALDQAVTASHGIRVVVAVYGEAAHAPLDVERRNEYCTYVRSLLERYPTVNDVVVWNEPNSSRFWSPQFAASGNSAAPAAYTALLARCWDVLHDFRHEVNVLGPATSAHGYDLHAGPRKSHSPINFIYRMGEAYQLTGRTDPLFDTIAHHAYGLSSAERPWRRHEDELVVGQGDWDKLVGAYRVAFADTAQLVPGECESFDCLGIWYTETGYQVAPDARHAKHYRGRETESGVLRAGGAGERTDAADGDGSAPAPDQATQILDAVRLAHCQPYVEGFFNFLLRDEPDLAAWQSGVQWADGTWKPSLPAFQQAIREAREGTINCSALKGGPIAGVDTSPPAAPTSVTAKATASGVALRWPAGSERDLAGYQVYRSESADGEHTVLAELLPARKLVDATAEPGKAYLYFVAARDSAGNESAMSAPASARP